MKRVKKGLPTEPYKGTRDFYPEDMRVRNYIFSAMRKVAERYGYAEYDASILESAELYRSKTSEEIVHEQTYTFTDRGGREVTLRPEMTPTVARMVAHKRRDIAFPARWYSIPNCFRYERPQRGRTREFWQLNVDIFGDDTPRADVEIIAVAHDIMKEFGAKDDAFEICINNRGALKAALMEKGMSEADADNELSKMDKGKGSIALDAATPDALTEKVISMLRERGITNVRFDSTLIRGFAYYTGVVFEVFDTSGKNNRSLFGGGRYDNLLELFGDEKVSGVGFGMGDVTARDYLETHGLLPNLSSTTDVYICVLSEGVTGFADETARHLRASDVNVAVDYTGKKAAAQIKTAEKQGIPTIICIGDEEQQTKTFKVKNLATREEKTVSWDELPGYFEEKKDKENINCFLT